MLANVEFKFQPFPRGPFALALPHAALPGSKVLGFPGYSISQESGGLSCDGSGIWGLMQV